MHRVLGPEIASCFHEARNDKILGALFNQGGAVHLPTRLCERPTTQPSLLGTNTASRQ